VTWAGLILNVFSDGEFNFQSTKTFAAVTCLSCNRRVAHRCALDGIAGDARRLSSLISRTNHGRDSVLRLWALRQERSPACSDLGEIGRQPITVAGTDRCWQWICMRRRFRGFFDIPVDHLYAAPVFIGYYQDHPLPNLTVVAPDTGGAERARAYAKRLDAELHFATSDARRPTCRSYECCW